MSGPSETLEPGFPMVGVSPTILLAPFGAKTETLETLETEQPSVSGVSKCFCYYRGLRSVVGRLFNSKFTIHHSPLRIPPTVETSLSS